MAEESNQHYNMQLKWLTVVYVCILLHAVDIMAKA